MCGYIPGKTTVVKWIEVKEWVAQNPPNIRAFAKWYFDLIKNAFVVVALAYAAKKTGYTTLKIVLALPASIFCWELLSYPITAIGWIISLAGRLRHRFLFSSLY